MNNKYLIILQAGTESHEMIKVAYDRLTGILGYLRSPFLLSLRLVWGWQLFQTGKGKLANIGPVIEFFQGLGIPSPSFNAHLVGITEYFGGLFLLLGLASRVITIPLTVTMVVAYLTADFEAVKTFFTDSDAFVKAAPFPFLITSLIVMIFGAGFFSLDQLIGSYFKRRQGKKR